MRERGSRVAETLKICSIVAATAIVVSLAMPLGASAAGQLFTLVDSDSDTQAQVDDTGKLRIGDGAGSLTVDGSVGIASSPGTPVSARESAKVFADSMVFTGLPANTVKCEQVGIGTGNLIRIETIGVSASGAAAPSAWVRLETETKPSYASSLDLDLQLAPSKSTFPWTGINQVDLIAGGGYVFNLDGIPGSIQLCGRAPSGNASTIRFVATGVYLNA